MRDILYTSTSYQTSLYQKLPSKRLSIRIYTYVDIHRNKCVMTKEWLVLPRSPLDDRSSRSEAHEPISVIMTRTPRIHHRTDLYCSRARCSGRHTILQSAPSPFNSSSIKAMWKHGSRSRSGNLISQPPGSLRFFKCRRSLLGRLGADALRFSKTSCRQLH
jgi:hypothetical protein